MKPLLVTSGEPAGVGPELCLALAGQKWPIVVFCDKSLLADRAKALNKSLVLVDYHKDEPLVMKPNHLMVHSIPCREKPIAGELNFQNSSYVIRMLTEAVNGCLEGEFSALITAPIHKAIINKAGFAFTGHTEFFAEHCHTPDVVMMLASDQMKMALVTTHLPLREVPDAVNSILLTKIITQLHHSLKQDFAIPSPKIYVAGLNPHAGESGYLGREELDLIQPAIARLREMGIDVSGPFPADTLFTPQHAKACDAFVAMYHDQGLPVLKFASFGHAVNITLGLPIIRTSVDHGTALDLAGTGRAETSSLLAAVEMAASMVEKRQ